MKSLFKVIIISEKFVLVILKLFQVNTVLVYLVIVYTNAYIIQRV